MQILPRPRPLSFSASLLALAAAATGPACDDRMRPAEVPPPSSLESMPRAPVPVTSAAAPESAVVDVSDAGPTDDENVPHAVRVTTCAIDKRGCRLAQPSSPPSDSSYRVVFGRGIGMIRTRSQAMAELYKEIRDRTGPGAHLEARTRHLGDPLGDTSSTAPRSAARAGDEPLVEVAFQLMDAVDRHGELTIDPLPQRGAHGCKLSLGTGDLDAGATRCLLDGPGGSDPSGRGR